jgi:hypothetical protein
MRVSNFVAVTTVAYSLPVPLTLLLLDIVQALSPEGWVEVRTQ